MAKFTIAQTPTFTGQVAIPRVGQPAVMVDFTFKYRGRLEIAALHDEWYRRRQEGLEAVGKSPEISTLTRLVVDQQVLQVKELVEGWAFDDEFSDENIKALVDSCDGAVEAIVKAFEEAYVKARTGN